MMDTPDSGLCGPRGGSNVTSARGVLDTNRAKGRCGAAAVSNALETVMRRWTHSNQLSVVHGGVVMSRVHSGIPLLWLVWIPLLCVIVWVRVSLGECPTPPTLRAPHVPSAIVLCL